MVNDASTGNLVLALASALLVIAVVNGAAAQQARLNLLLITADDMNADSSGWMGNKLGATPNLDAFAASGCRFVNNHVTVPICQPGRSAFMTGRVPHRNGALGFNPINDGRADARRVAARRRLLHRGDQQDRPHGPADQVPLGQALEGSGKNPELFRQQIAECFAAAAAAKKPFFINANITDPHRPFFGSAQGRRRRPSKAKKAKKAAIPKANRPA